MVALSAPIGLKISNNEVSEPDVLVLKEMSNETLEGHYIVEPPLLVIEVLSPSTQHRDWGIKKQLYEKFRIKEYWIINTSNLELSKFILVNEKYKLQTKINLNKSPIESTILHGFKFGPISYVL